MIKVNINILCSEWEFRETLPFSVLTIEEKEGDFELPLYNDEGEEVNTITLPNCKFLELHGEEDDFIVVIEKDLVRSWTKNNPDESVLQFDIDLEITQNLWQQGEEIGVFYPWDKLPQELKDVNIA